MMHAAIATLQKAARQFERSGDMDGSRCSRIMAQLRDVDTELDAVERRRGHREADTIDLIAILREAAAVAGRGRRRRCRAVDGRSDRRGPGWRFARISFLPAQLCSCRRARRDHAAHADQARWQTGEAGVRDRTDDFFRRGPRFSAAAAVGRSPRTPRRGLDRLRAGLLPRRVHASHRRSQTCGNGHSVS